MSHCFQVVMLKMLYSFVNHVIKNIWAYSGEAAGRRRVFNQMAVFENAIANTHCVMRAFGYELNWARRCFCVWPYGYNLCFVCFPAWKIQCGEHDGYWFYWWLCPWWGIFAVCWWGFSMQTVCVSLSLAQISVSTLLSYRVSLLTEAGECNERAARKQINSIQGTICKRLSVFPVSSNMTGLDHTSVTTSGPHGSSIGLPVSETQQSSMLHITLLRLSLLQSGQ